MCSMLLVLAANQFAGLFSRIVLSHDVSQAVITY